LSSWGRWGGQTLLAAGTLIMGLLGRLGYESGGIQRRQPGTEERCPEMMLEKVDGGGAQEARVC